MKSANKLTWAIVLACLFCLNSCTQKKQADKHAIHWSYSGSTGPDHWGDLSPQFVLCKSGLLQSPIDIASPQAQKGVPLKFSYQPCKLYLQNNGHTIQQTYDGKSTLKVNGKTFTLLQFHFHSESEHTISNRRYAMEMHLVHKSADGDIAVVGILFKRGAVNTFLKSLWPALPMKANLSSHSARTIDVADAIPAGAGWYAYEGSFTTPPGTEGVKWFLLSQPVEMSPDQLATFRKAYAGNFRPVQPLNGRKIIHYQP